MLKLSFNWKEKTGTYQTGEYLYLNKIRIGGFYWNSARSQGNTEKSIDWAGSIDLPSLSDKNNQLYGNSPEEIKAKIELIIANWFIEALS